eukprot:CAMPEP_0113322680 /NCGR_PEP_ID=MMETSP0010_2-20120614/15767_1 /TAXON_ID=216773 ORGANISM="Corethron hystrix, Strain 308" /NCGR_SAMPLE_ID=MMETSP0010_2 /ASSEMBLY_ACC=CAM_ASM_000155 /LENGTH=213 /DNA_ID=CAMNT_0000181261 /DNA_START=107 /DNA_END=748 /DNA_ORIENTATION=- /assembly_acc=CAM_ASM_000155
MTARSLANLATFRLSKTVSLMVMEGSVIDFSSPVKGAIVNAANEGCLGGGGVDGAIGEAGGPNLFHDRESLPIFSDGIRCPTGSAVLTGPGEYGTLQVPYVIHAVGPSYFSYPNFETPDKLLQSAYQTSLEITRQEGITEVAFSLLSAGVFRGKRDLESVLKIGITGIKEWIKKSDDSGDLKSIFLVGFTPIETKLLVEICANEFEESVNDEL